MAERLVAVELAEEMSVQRDGAIGAAVIACAVALGVYLNPASLGLCPLP